MKKNTHSFSRLRVADQAAPLLILFMLITSQFFLSSCDLRKDPTLPPGLIPEEYVESNYIYSVDNFLIKSSNDDTYLYIERAAIADSTIRIGDQIYFSRTESIPDRDSLHVNVSAALSNAFGFYIYRDSTWCNLALNRNYPYITIYTTQINTPPAATQNYCLNQNAWLDAMPAALDSYAKGCVSFHPFGTGSNQAVAVSNEAQTLSFSANQGNHYAFIFGTQDRISYFLPVAAADTRINIASLDSLDAASAAEINTIYPSFGVFSSVVSLSASTNLGNSSSVPLMKMHNLNLDNRFPLQWIIQSEAYTYALGQSPETWEMIGNDLIAPCKYNGNYLLIVPLETQTSLSIPLDAGLHQIYCQNFWADLSDLTLSGITMSVELDADPAETIYMNTHYQNAPYALTNPAPVYRIRFYSNGDLLESLPNDAWLEVGKKVSSADQNARLYRFYTAQDKDAFSYKTYGTEYDITHYTYGEDHIYDTISQSGYYFLSSSAESNTGYHLPMLKNSGEFQTDKAMINWSNLTGVSGSGYSIDVAYSGFGQELSYLTSHYHNHPYSLSNIGLCYKLGFSQNGANLETLPNDNWIEFGRAMAATNNSAKLFRFISDSSKDSFTYSTYAASYDSTHYTYSSDQGYMYHPVMSSGIYFLNNSPDNTSGYTIPVLKGIGEFQTDKAYVYWSGANRQFDQYNISFPTSYVTSHPWFNGHPYAMAGYRGAVTAHFSLAGTNTASVPNVYYLEFNAPTSSVYQHLVTFSEIANHYVAKLFQNSTTADGDHFFQTGNRIAAYPLYGGTLILGNITNQYAPAFDITMYPNMYLETNQTKVSMQSTATIAANTSLQVNVASAFNDPFAGLSQYNLTRTSPVYNLSIRVNGVADTLFYENSSPLVYLKRSTAKIYKNRTEYLFTVAGNINNRVYSYPTGDYTDGYHYDTENSFNRFLLSHNGQFASMTDNAPHSIITRTLTPTTQDFILSLYQAEFILPGSLSGIPALQGLSYSLSLVNDLNVFPGAVSGYNFRTLNSQNQLVIPGFITNYLPLRYPVLYVPFPVNYADQNVNLYYKDPSGITTQFVRVDNLVSGNINEYMIYGNCAICYVDNPGTYYITPGAKNTAGKHRKAK